MPRLFRWTAILSWSYIGLVAAMMSVGHRDLNLTLRRRGPGS